MGLPPTTFEALELSNKRFADAEREIARLLGDVTLAREALFDALNHERLAPADMVRPMVKSACERADRLLARALATAPDRDVPSGQPTPSDETEAPRAYCLECGETVTADENDECPECGEETVPEIGWQTWREIRAELSRLREAR